MFTVDQVIAKIDGETNGSAFNLLYNLREMLATGQLAPGMDRNEIVTKLNAYAKGRGINVVLA